jgi:putative ABC transport system substrate-binding protein
MFFQCQFWCRLVLLLGSRACVLVREGKLRKSHDSGLLTLAIRFIAVVLFATVNGAAIAAQRVTLLIERGASTYRQTADGFRNSLTDIDLEEVEIDEGGRPSQNIGQQSRRAPPDLVVAIGTRATRVATQQFRNSPILYCLTLAPRAPLQSASKLGGMALDVPLSRQLDGIRKVLPSLRKVGIVYDELTSGPEIDNARRLGLPVVARNARTPQEAKKQIYELFHSVLEPGDAFWLLWDPVAANPANFRTLVELSLKNKIALIAPARPFVEAGALISVGADYGRAGTQLAQMAEAVLAGSASPGDFDAIDPDEVTITINGKVARQLGIAIPASLRADILSPAEGVDAP